MSEKERLLRRIQECDFVLLETSLFLDVNPTNQNALAHYRTYQALHKEALDKYVKKYGPLSHSDYDGGSTWAWTNNPWPWDNTEEV